MRRVSLKRYVKRDFHDGCTQTVEAGPGNSDELCPTEGGDDHLGMVEDPSCDVLPVSHLADDRRPSTNLGLGGHRLLEHLLQIFIRTVPCIIDRQ